MGNQENSKLTKLLISLTEIGTFLVAIVAIVGGSLFLWHTYDEVIDYKTITGNSFPKNTLSHSIMTASVILLISFQCLRLAVITIDFFFRQNWAYFIMGVFIFSVIIYSLTI